MSIVELAAIAEIVAAIAVVITLGYLSIQIRQSSHSIQNSTSWAITQALFAINGRWSSDGEFTELWLRGLKSYEDLNDVEQERFRAFAMDLLNLAHYVQKHPTEEHVFVVPFVASLVRDKPGFRQVVEDAAWSLRDELCRELGISK